MKIKKNKNAMKMKIIYQNKSKKYKNNIKIKKKCEAKIINLKLDNIYQLKKLKSRKLKSLCYNNLMNRWYIINSLMI